MPNLKKDAQFVTYFLLNPVFVAKYKTTYASLGASSRQLYTFTADRPVRVTDPKDAARFRTMRTHGTLRLVECTEKGKVLTSQARMAEQGDAVVPQSYARYQGARPAAQGKVGKPTAAPQREQKPVAPKGGNTIRRRAGGPLVNQGAAAQG